MYKVIIEYFAWPSSRFDIWHRSIEDLMLEEEMDGEWQRVWPWPEKIDFLYTVSKRETIILTFKSKEDWDECRKDTDYEDIFNFKSLNFFEYLFVSFAKTTIFIGEYLEG